MTGAPLAPTAQPAPPTPTQPHADGYCRGRGGFATLTPGAPAGAALGTQQGSAIRPANTFSIVARDPVTGELGVAVQSHWFNVGALVAWAEPGVGAVATQSFVDPAYGPNGLAAMRAGTSAPDALAQLVAKDAGAGGRQLGFVDAQGRAAAHTGARCIQFANHHAGTGFTVQANLMGNDKVVPAMRAAFEAAKGDLADRMLAALDAGQAAGGDLRGCQSAAIVVVSGDRKQPAWQKKLDLRVEDHAAPIAELRRLVTLARAYDQMNQGDAAVDKNDLAAALAHYGNAVRFVPDSVEMVYWQAVALAGKGQVDAALPLFRKAFAADAAWIELTNRLIAPGILPDTPAGRAAVERVLREARPR
ncbi:MAG: DUF1028 domain-containing protein [Deltaproteobacteria bacterium]|nr:DUF1028 domain-containing protein [Deltaproteobacteria bacterium]